MISDQVLTQAKSLLSFGSGGLGKVLSGLQAVLSGLQAVLRGLQAVLRSLRVVQGRSFRQ